MFTMWPIKATPGLHAQVNVAPTQNRLASHSSVSHPDAGDRFRRRRVVPAYLGAEVAAAIPNAAYLEIPRHRPPRLHREARRRQHRDPGILRQHPV